VLGPVLAALGIAVYVLQMRAQRLITPWYMPGLATLGVAMVLVSLRQRRTVWRVLALGAVSLVAGLEWLFLLAMGQPPYTGPIVVGQPFPAFATMRADGTTFTQRDLVGDHSSVLVFFRGRW
jgi:hypothetical protein